MIWWVMVTLGLVVVCDAVLRVLYARLMLPRFETKPIFQAPRVAPNPRAEAIAFSTSHHLTLRGSLHFPEQCPPRAVVLFCPELDGSHWTASEYCRGLLEAGFAVLSFDFRNQGESDHQANYEPLHWPTAFEAEDVSAALGYLDSRADLAALPRGVMGISRGGQVALWMASVEPRFHAVCCEGAYDSESLQLYFTLRWGSLYLPAWMYRICPAWHYRGTLWLVRRLSELRRGVQYLSIGSGLREIREQGVLLITGERDNYVHPEIAAGLRDQMKRTDRDFWVVPRAKHNQARQMNPVEYDRRVSDFFLRHLRVERPSPTFEKMEVA